MQRHHRLIADDGCFGARLERIRPRAQRSEQPTPDHDVVGAFAKGHLDDGGIAWTQRRGHGACVPIEECGTPNLCASAATISSTMVSCGTSRECTVTSDSAYTG